ncbi:MAG TPA: alkaline phosphatase family protein [Solirubrobacteraceae bacterium]|nr:alkaline phosphatase family protein [Solirubrobacteraceae bacterium]
MVACVAFLALTPGAGAHGGPPGPDHGQRGEHGHGSKRGHGHRFEHRHGHGHKYGHERPTGLPRGLDKIVVVYLENHSFDNLYGLFPKANGLDDADAAHTIQVDLAGTPLKCLPQNDPHLTSPPLPADACSTANGDALDSHFPNAPFRLNDYFAQSDKTRDLVHRYYQNIVQIDGGKNDKFTAVSDALGLTQGYWDTRQLPLFELARRYTLADNFFQAAFGGSFLNHMWLACACTPVFPGAPDSMRTVLDPATGLPAPGGDHEMVTKEEGDYVVNTAFTHNTPHPANADPAKLVPDQTAPTIGDRLSAKNVSWAWYSGGWDDAVAGHPDPLFQFHHQPYAYFANYADGTPGRAQHLKDETEFFAAARAGRLPKVSFVKPIGADNEHPGYADLLTGERHVMDLVDAVRSGRDWKRAAIVITYDEFGGQWDHVPPPLADKWGPGTRIPALVVSPYARRHHVDHTQYDTTSVLALIERRFGLAPLTARDAHANDMTAAFRRGR